MELKLKAGMYVQCSWCQRYENVNGEFVVANNVDPSKQITHTCCEECMEKVMAEIEESKS